MIAPTTTTIAVQRTAAYDSWDAAPPAATTVGTVAGHISTPSGTERVDGGASQSEVTHRLDCEPVDLRHGDRVVADGVTYEVVWAVPRSGLGLDHVEAGLRLVEGLA